MLSTKPGDPELLTEIPKVERMEVPEHVFYTEKEMPEDSFTPRTDQRSSRRGGVKENKRTLNLLVSMSAVLFIVCFILGAGLVQSQSRIETMEEQIFQLSAAYRSLYGQVANPVFAPSPTESTMIGEAEQPYVPTIATNGGLEIDGIPVHPPANPQQTIEAPVTPPATPAVGTPAVATRSIPETYVIQPGDSLTSISMYFFGENRVDEILALNGMDNADMIIAGSIILLP